MSLINKVLNDLDHRNPTAQRGSGSAVVTPVRFAWLRWVALAAVVLLGVALLWWLLTDDSPAQSPAASVQAPTTQPIKTANQKPQTETQTEPQPSTEPTAATTPVTVNTTNPVRQEPSAQGKEPSADVEEPSAPRKEPSAPAEQPTAEQQQPVAQTPPSSAEQQQPTAEQPTAAEPGRFSKQSVQLSAAEIAERQWQKAKQAQQQGLFSDAATHYRAALNALPQQHDIRKEWAALEFGRGQASQALAVLREGLTQFPQAHSLRLLAASMLEKQAQPSLALQLLQQAQPKASALPQYYQLQANLAQQQGQQSVMRDSYQALISAQPDNGRWHLGLALALREQQPQQALAAFEQAAVRIEHTPTLNFIAEQIKLIRSQHATSTP